MVSTPKVAILEQCQITPPSGTIDQLTLPLTFLDISWLPFHLIQRLLFYKFPCSKSHFEDTIVPDLKHSLSLTLKHFLPLAAKLIYPFDDNMPEIRYVTGDSVSLTFAEYTGNDFDYLTGNHARNSDEFYSFLPQFPPVEELSDCKVIPLLALQVTLFSDVGICIGFVNHHAVGDASTVIGFMKAWALINKLGGDSHLLDGNLQPCYDRSVIKYPSELDTLYWNMFKNIKLGDFGSVNLPTNKVRAKYVICQDRVKMFKNIVSINRPSVAHVSAFTVTCAFIWTCLVKSSVAIGEVSKDDDEYFICAVDCRARLNPPVPSTYLGNCLAPCIVRSTRTELVGDEGFLTAAESIGEAIRARVHNEKGILADAEIWMSKIGQTFGKSSVGVSGSPKFDVYDTDYGWGKAKTFESVSIDIDGGISLSKSRDSDGSLEVALSLPKTKMDAFAITFANGLNIE